MPEENLQNERKSILDHISDLRFRILLSLAAVIVGAVVADFFRDQILFIILKPAGGQNLIFLSPLDPLFFILKIDLLAGFILAFPIISWCFLSYIKPAFSRRTNSILYVSYGSSVALLLAGLSYTYFLITPLTLKFLYSIAVHGVENVVTAQSYLSFFLTQSFLIAIIFQIPLVIILGVYINLFKIETLSSKRRYVYLISTIALGILTPTPDAFNLLILLFPTIAIFELSLVIGRLLLLFSKRKIKTVKVNPTNPDRV